MTVINSGHTSEACWIFIVPYLPVEEWTLKRLSAVLQKVAQIIIRRNWSRERHIHVHVHWQESQKLSFVCHSNIWKARLFWYFCKLKQKFRSSPWESLTLPVAGSWGGDGKSLPPGKPQLWSPKWRKVVRVPGRRQLWLLTLWLVSDLLLWKEVV